MLWFKDGYDLTTTVCYYATMYGMYLFPRASYSIVEGFVGYDRKRHVDYNRWPVMGAHQMGGASSTDLIHYASLIRTGRFNDRNGTDYPLHHLKERLAHADILLFQGEWDNYVKDQDIAKLLSFLPNNKTEHYKIPDYNHVDYMWADDTFMHVNDRLTAFVMKQVSN